jgi:hypothetical protein
MKDISKYAASDSGFWGKVLKRLLIQRLVQLLFVMVVTEL